MTKKLLPLKHFRQNKICLYLENGYKSNDIDFKVEIPIIVPKSESQTRML